MNKYEITWIHTGRVYIIEGVTAYDAFKRKYNLDIDEEAAAGNISWCWLPVDDE